MIWNIEVYAEPGTKVDCKTVIADAPPLKTAATMLPEGMMALVRGTDQQRGYIEFVPACPRVELPFDSLVGRVTEGINSGRWLWAARLMRGAVDGPEGGRPDLLLLAASVYELLAFHGLARDCLSRALDKLDSAQRPGALVRLARAVYRDAGSRDEARVLLEEGMSSAELPVTLRVEGLLLSGQLERSPEPLEAAVKLARQQLGEHPLLVTSLVALADQRAEQQPQQAEAHYQEAMRLQARFSDGEFFNTAERLARHLIRGGDLRGCLDLCAEVFESLRACGLPQRDYLPFLLAAAEVHRRRGDEAQRASLMEKAMAIDFEGAARLDGEFRALRGA
ncbi:MAG: hypothetical protein KC910_10190 [Candidatus Eremiobacteraeota bacterium]|nr:hypothetical protein [Candidatus Eremiobacteraeota bacterium]